METTPKNLYEPGDAFTRVRRDRYDVVVIGGGQAGLSVGYHLRERGLRFVILDAAERIGDAWRQRWDSLRLFTPARYSGLDGMPFPAPPFSFPTKDEMGDYLESYAARFELPVESGTRVDRVTREGDRFVVTAGERQLIADSVVVAMATYQRPWIPDFAADLDPSIRQIHSSDYRNPDQLKPGSVLVVGAGNSGAEVGIELAGDRRVWVSGDSPGELPFRIGGFWGRLFLVRLVLRVLFHRVLTIHTRLGRKLYPKLTRGSGPLIRTRDKDLVAAGVERVGRTEGVAGGKPRLADGRVLDADNVIWCTGFKTGFPEWIDLPIFGERGKPKHTGGVVESAPGLYFVGLHFQCALSSGMIHGVGRDAARIARHISGKLCVDERRHQAA